MTKTLMLTVGFLLSITAVADAGTLWQRCLNTASCAKDAATYYKAQIDAAVAAQQATDLAIISSLKAQIAALQAQVAAGGSSAVVKPAINATVPVGVKTKVASIAIPTGTERTYGTADLTRTLNWFHLPAQWDFDLMMDSTGKVPVSVDVSVTTEVSLAMGGICCWTYGEGAFVITDANGVDTIYPIQVTAQ